MFGIYTLTSDHPHFGGQRARWRIQISCTRCHLTSRSLVNFMNNNLQKLEIRKISFLNYNLKKVEIKKIVCHSAFQENCSNS